MTEPCRGSPNGATAGPNAYPPDQSALDVFGQLRRMTEEAGRDPVKVGIEVWVSMGTGAEADWAKGAQF